MDNLRRIILTFTLIVLVALAVTGIYLAFLNTSEQTTKQVKLNPSDEKFSGSIDENPSETPEPEKTLSRCLVVVKGYNSENLYVIADVNGESALSLTFLPAETKISVKLSGEPFNLTLTELQKRGMDVLIDAISGKFSMRLSKYIVMDMDGLGNLINYFSSRDNGVLFSLPFSFTVNTNGKKVEFVKGKDYFDGYRGSILVNFSRTDDGIYDKDILKFYDGTDTGHLKMASAFANDFALQKLVGNIDDYYKDNYSAFLNMFIEQYAQTNISSEEAELVAKDMLSVKDGAVSTYILSANENTLVGVKMGDDNIILENFDEGSKKQFIESLR